ncbi:hypothetical protein E8E12_008837 [Didymella heteroderae]|uniref:C2H2-type domain-containing protein n=1 Tax=Didymella heteroderae TaxID=1769908 RepID=A0A9P5C1Y1_9PLEO|nr:hypothetical protein E8E12_008837 [Didymella heteroderae]
MDPQQYAYLAQDLADHYNVSVRSCCSAGPCSCVISHVLVLTHNERPHDPTTHTPFSTVPASDAGILGGVIPAVASQFGVANSSLFQLDAQTPGTELTVPAPGVGPPTARQALSILAEAIVLTTEDGHFICSEQDCNASYRRIGDCRRHLKKHNGPFFPCEQRGCGMNFYRHDKLRAHMQQGHGIAISPPGNRRRQRRSAAGR